MVVVPEQAHLYLSSYFMHSLSLRLLQMFIWRGRIGSAHNMAHKIDTKSNHNLIYEHLITNPSLGQCVCVPWVVICVKGVCVQCPRLNPEGVVISDGLLESSSELQNHLTKLPEALLPKPQPAYFFIPTPDKYLVLNCRLDRIIFFLCCVSGCRRNVPHMHL